MTADSRTRMLEATAHLLYHKGFHGTSLNDILAESGAPRGSLYYHFPGGKEQLVLEAMLQQAELVTQMQEECFAEGRDPVVGVRSYMAGAAQVMRDTGFIFGCPIAPQVLDLAPESSALARACRETLERWQQILGKSLSSAGIEPQRAESLATLILSSVEGALILARARQDTAPLELIAEELAVMVQDALPGSERLAPAAPDGR